jgi:hypothetical protein
MKTYPIFASEIARINFTFGNLNRLPSDNGGFIDSLKNAVKNCLDSPCNLFTETSDTVGKLSQGTLFATNGTTLPIGDLKDSFSTFAGGISTTLFNKVPEIIQKSITSLKFIGKQAWSESMTMLAGDSLPDLVAKAQSGTSLRNNTAGYRYTPDLKSYLDLSEVASDILGGIADDMGDCFRRYQQSARYNPYDPAQNTSDVSKSPVSDQVNGATFFRTLLGQPDNSNTSGSLSDNLTVPGNGNKQLTPSTIRVPMSVSGVTSPVTSTDSLVTPVYDFRSPGKGGDGELTVFTALLEGKTFITDNTRDINTEAGKSAFPKNVPFIPPNSYNAYKKLIKEGKTNNTDLTKVDKNKINNGFAMNLNNLAKLLGNGYNSASIRKIMNGNQSDKWVYAEITPSVGTKQIVQLIDTNIAKGSRTAIDLTLYAWNKTFTGATLPIPNQKPVDYSKEGEKTAIYSYSAAPDVSAKVRFIVGKISDVGSNTADTGCTAHSDAANQALAMQAAEAVATLKLYIEKNGIVSELPNASWLSEIISATRLYNRATNERSKKCAALNVGVKTVYVLQRVSEGMIAIASKTEDLELRKKIGRDGVNINNQSQVILDKFLCEGYKDCDGTKESVGG